MAEQECGICDECGSAYRKAASKMQSLCPECAHLLYGYPRCHHVFEKGKCIYCYWNGKQSGFLQSRESYRKHLQ